MTWLLELLARPLTGQIVDLVKSYQNRKVSEAEIEAGVTKALITAVNEMTAHDVERVRAELKAEDWLTRNWRALLGLMAGAPIPFFAMIVPIAVDWIGLPPLRTGDLVLEWTLKLSIACLGLLGIDSLSASIRRRAGG